MDLSEMTVVTGGRTTMVLGGRMLLVKTQMEVSVTTTTKPRINPFHMGGHGVLANRKTNPQMASDLVSL